MKNSDLQGAWHVIWGNDGTNWSAPRHPVYPLRPSPPPAPLRSHHQRRDRHFGGDERATEVHRGVGLAARPSVRPSSLRCSPRGASNPNIHERNARYTMTKPSGSAAAMTPACCIVLLRPLKKCGWTDLSDGEKVSSPPSVRPRRQCSFSDPNSLFRSGCACMERACLQSR